MKKTLSKQEAKDKIEEYFKGKLDKDKTKKIKRLAMKYKIRLGDYRKKFCKKCLEELSKGKIRIANNYKIVECKCGFKNRWKIRTF